MSGIETSEAILEKKVLSKEQKTTVVKMLGEFLIMKYHHHAAQKESKQLLETADKLCSLFIAELGDQHDLYIDAVYLQSKALFVNAVPQMSVNVDKLDKALSNLDAVIAYYKKQTKPKLLQYAMCVILQATINKHILQEAEAVRGFLKAGKIIMKIEKTLSIEMMVQNILKEIEETKSRYKERTGKELDTDELELSSDEESEEFKPSQT